MAEATEREAKAKKQKAEKLTQESKQKAEKLTQETGKEVAEHPPSTSGQHTTGPVANDNQTRSDSKCSFLNSLHVNSFLFSNCIECTVFQYIPC